MIKLLNIWIRQTFVMYELRRKIKGLPLYVVFYQNVEETWRLKFMRQAIFSSLFRVVIILGQRGG